MKQPRSHVGASGRARALVVAGLMVAQVGTAAAEADDGVVRSLTGDESVRRFGLMADAGVPDGATASLVYRPVRALRISAGVGHNLISTGMRAGLTLVPFSWWVSPTLSVDIGRYPEGDANPLAQMVSGDDSFSNQALERVGYDFANAHAGLEFGRKWATFYIHGGMSRVSGALRGIDQDPDDEVTFTSDPTVTMWGVSARLGLIVYFYQ